MKYILIIMSVLFLAIMSQAAPDYMKDGTITVTLKDGSAYTFSANDYMVVKREVKKDRETTIIVNVTKCTILNECSEKKMNVLSIMGGMSATKLDSSFNGRDLKVEQGYEPDFGLLYQRRVKEDLLVNLMGTVRGSLLLGAGKEF